MVILIYVVNAYQIEQAERELFLFLDVSETEAEHHMRAIRSILYVVIFLLFAEQ